MADLLWDGPPAARDVVVLGHGAGAAMDSPFMTAVARGLADRGARVVRFEFPYMAARREGVRRGPDRPDVLLATWRDLVDVLGGGERLVIGGKSLGGRMASLIADEVGARGLVCLGYPFRPPGKTGRPRSSRTEHLGDLRTPTLIVQGDRDPFGGPEEVAGYSLSAAIRVEWIADGDHSFAPRKSSGRTLEQNLEAAIEAVATFVGTIGLTPAL